MRAGHGMSRVKLIDLVKRIESIIADNFVASNSSTPVGANAIVRGQPSHMSKWLVQCIILLLVMSGCLAVFVPFAPRFPNSSLDASWMYAINTAVDKGLIFGKDIIFTAGPYASIYTRQYHQATDTQMLWSSSLLAVALGVGLTLLARDRFKITALLIIPFLGLNIGDQLFFCIPLVFILIVYRITLPAENSDSLPATYPVLWSLALLVVALSLLPLIKGTFGIASIVAATFGWVLLMACGRKRLAISGALLFIAGISAFWVNVGQPITYLPAFFAAQAPIIGGYNDAMSISGQVREPIIYVLACCLLAVCHLGWVRSGGFSGAVLAAGVAFLLLLGFKAGFVRHDGHAVAAGGVVGLTAWILMIGLPGVRPILALAVCLIGWGIIDRHYDDLDFGTIKDRIAWSFVDSANGFATRIARNDILRRQFDESVAAIRLQQPLPPLEGTVDIYSFGQLALLANGLVWAPRPVLQSYSAYTSSLLEKDAAYLAGPKAPDNIIFSVQPIDYRLGALEDGLSWPALLTRYAPTGLIDYMAILRRRPEPTTDQVLRGPPIASGAYRLGEEIALPTVAGALWATVDVKPTLLGNILGLIYKLPQLTIEFRMADGTVNRFRYIAEMGKTGFVVSPLVQNASDFVALELPETAAYFADDRPQAMKISIVGGTSAQWWWREGLSLQLFKMNIPPQPEAGALLFSQAFVEETVGAEIGKLPETKDCRIDAINNHPADKIPAGIKGALRIQGWAAMSIEDSATPDQTRMILTGKDGRSHSLVAKIAARSDVNQYFDKPGLGNVGFSAIADISKFDGVYTLEIQVSSGNDTRACAKRVVLSIAATHAADK